MRQSTKGVLIIIEGADGTGTTTQSKLLFNWLSEKYPHTRPILTAEPTEGHIGCFIRKILNKEIKISAPPVGIAALFFADRMEHLEVQINPALENGQWVICDRNWQSSLVYQGITQSLFDARWVANMHRGFTPPTSYCFVLDVPSDVTRRRRKDRNQDEQLYETDPFQACVLEAYQQIPQWDWRSEVILCGCMSVAEVQKRIQSRVMPLLNT